MARTAAHGSPGAPPDGSGQAGGPASNGAIMNTHKISVTISMLI